MIKPVLFVGLPAASAAFPKAFDAREQWPECVTPVRDVGVTETGGCAAEWAMTAAQTLQTNLCVQGLKTPELSAEEIGSCHQDIGLYNLLCEIWTINTAWEYMDDQ